MRLLYSFSIRIYYLGILCASLFNKKAKLWMRGRKNLFPNLEKTILELRTPNSELIWFHCASLGEFEQGRPVMEKLKAQNPNVKILLSFFSPSGYEIRKNYVGADYVCYLPMDFTSNAKKFLDIVKPSKIIFIKYEFWFNFLLETFKRKIPCYLISASFRLDQYFFKSYGGWFRKKLKNFTHIFAQSEEVKNILEIYDFANVSVSGDTRFDRVYDVAKTHKPIPLAEIFCADSKIIVCGSTWSGDEEILADMQNMKANIKMIIAPHEIDESHLLQIEKLFSSRKTIRFSKATEQNITEANILLIDNIGMLSSLYHYAYVTYVGGGFNKTVHNILEPAAHGKPIIFGHKFYKFREAFELIEKGGAFTVNSALELSDRLNFLFQDPLVLKMASMISENYVRENKGATQIIFSKIGN